MNKIFFLLLFFAFAQNSYAGMCIAYPPGIIKFNNSEAIFIGKILSIKRYYGIKKTQSNWNVKYRIVEFEVQKNYKGTVAGTKVSVINPYDDIDWENLKLKKGQQWEIYVYKYEGNLLFGTGCVPWSELIETQTDLSDSDQNLLSLKNKIERDKQAIVGRVSDFLNVKKIENAEVNIEGNNQQISVKTDREGRYYIPLEFTGSYKITIKFPAKSMFFYSNSNVGKEQLQELRDNNSFTYKINLTSGEFNYFDLSVGFY